MYTYTYVYVYIYIYIYYTHMCVCIYIYICTLTLWAAVPCKHATRVSGARLGRGAKSAALSEV